MLFSAYKLVMALRDDLVKGDWETAKDTALQLLLMLLGKTTPVACGPGEKEPTASEFQQQYAAIQAAMMNPPKEAGGGLSIAVMVLQVLAPLIKKIIDKKLSEDSAIVP